MIEMDRVGAVLLAAGRAERFGSDKLLAMLDGEPLALHAARRIAQIAPGCRTAVCADGTGALADHLSALGFRIVVNSEGERGLSHSLALGIAAIADTGAAAALVCLADMPFVTAGHLHALIARFDAQEAPIVASSDGQAAMPPAIFARAIFPALLAGTGDSGARALLRDAALVAAGSGELADIDKPGDLLPQA